MQNILNEIRKAQRKNPGLRVSYDGIYSYVHAISSKQCAFCLGFAHTAKQC